MKKVLVVAPGKATRGGITTIVNTIEETSIWAKYSMKWIETYRDASSLVKVFYFVRAFVLFCFSLNGYDIVHIHTPGGNSFYRKFPIFLLARFFKKKTIIHLNAPYEESIFIQPPQRYMRFMLAKADSVIVVAPSWRDILLKHMPELSNISVVFNPATVSVTENRKNNYKVLFAGTVCDRKGYADLIKAFARVAPDFAEAHLYFAGNGSIKEGQQIAHDLAISDRVTFLGWISGAEKKKWYRTCSIYCLPSYGEGMPLGVLDALGYGMYVISTPVGGTVDLLDDNINGVLIAPGNLDELSAALIAAFSNDQRFESITRNGLNLAISLSPEIIASQLDDIYQSLYTSCK